VPDSPDKSAPGLGGVWQVLERRVLADRSPFAMIWDEDLLLPDGSTITNFIRVDIVPFAIVFAQLEDGRVPFVRQYRQAIQRVSLELPAGHIEAGEEPLHCAQRELLEEAGAESDDWQFLGRYVLEANRGCGYAHAFLARNARLVAAPNPGDVGDMALDFLSLDEVRAKLFGGGFDIAPTVMTVGMALHLLR
jgi:ADP-ribose pyrophosphatase